MDYKLIDTAMDYVRKNALAVGGDVVEWPKYEKMVLLHLKTEFDPRPKMPKEYYYAYLRVKGLKHAECLVKMGLGADDDRPNSGKKVFGGSGELELPLASWASVRSVPILLARDRSRHHKALACVCVSPTSSRYC